MSLSDWVGLALFFACIITPVVGIIWTLNHD